jgi:hypothetical protein
MRRAGKFALAQNQWMLAVLSPLGNIRRLYSTVPFLSLVVFFAIYIGIINQRETWSRYVRFNAMQVSRRRAADGVLLQKGDPLYSAWLILTGRYFCCRRFCWTSC